MKSSSLFWHNDLANDTQGGLQFYVIVGPMIYRTADAFLRGKVFVSKTFDSAGKVRRAIERNIDSLATFCDSFILFENLPMIDYGITFDPTVGLDSYDIIESGRPSGQIFHGFARASVKIY